MCILILYGKYDIILYKKYTGPSFSVNYPKIQISKPKPNRIIIGWNEKYQMVSDIIW